MINEDNDSEGESLDLIIHYVYYAIYLIEHIQIKAA
jgi:hypothetical protein